MGKQWIKFDLQNYCFSQLLTATHLTLHIEPEEGSLAGGTWITVIFDGKLGFYQTHIFLLMTHNPKE